MCICTYICIVQIYIYRERESADIYIYVYIYMHRRAFGDTGGAWGDLCKGLKALGRSGLGFRL